MKNRYWFTFTLSFLCLNLYGQETTRKTGGFQETRVTNSFVILINNNLTTTIAGLRLVLVDGSGKEETIKGGYYPGVLFVENTGERNSLYADSVRTLKLVFDDYRQSKNKENVFNYKIPIDIKWFKQSVIILRIIDINKRKGTYRYSFEVPGYYFAIKK